MAATVFDSRPLVTRMAGELRKEAARFRQQHHRPARLTQLVAGHDPAAEVYRRQLLRSCREIGLDCTTLAYPFEIQEEDLRAEVATASHDATTDGVVLLLPLPAHIRQRIVTDVLSPEKDVDGLGSRNAGNLLLGFPSFIPSTADVILRILQEAAIPVAARNAVVVGGRKIRWKATARGFVLLVGAITSC